MSITVGEAYATLSGRRRWYAYSGVVFGPVGAPTLITLVNIPNVGLKDSFIKILPYYGAPASILAGTGLGIEVSIDGISVLRSQADSIGSSSPLPSSYDLFIPRGSALLIESRNTLGNNTQDRGVIVLGSYMHGSDH